MTFTVTITQAPLSIQFEAGSIGEAMAILEKEDTALRSALTLADDLGGNEGTALASGTVEVSGEASSTKKRGRPAKDKTGPDPATATAPAPLPIPGATPALPTPPNPVLAAQVADAAANGTIPAFLQRTPEAAAPPPPPPAPPAPPVPPVAPPSGILAGKVMATLDVLKAKTVDEGKSLVDWLAHPSLGVVNAGVSYDEAIAVIRLMPDDKLGVVATALSVA